MLLITLMYVIDHVIIVVDHFDVIDHFDVNDHVIIVDHC